MSGVILVPARGPRRSRFNRHNEGCEYSWFMFCAPSRWDGLTASQWTEGEMSGNLFSFNLDSLLNHIDWTCKGRGAALVVILKHTEGLRKLSLVISTQGIPKVSLRSAGMLLFRWLATAIFTARSWGLAVYISLFSREWRRTALVSRKKFLAGDSNDFKWPGHTSHDCLGLPEKVFGGKFKWFQVTRSH